MDKGSAKMHKCAVMIEVDDMTTFNKEDPLLNLTLDTDELGIWLINEAPEGTQQMGHISWKELARGVQQALLREKFLIRLLEIDKDLLDE
jgi:hypothetical protein